MYGGTEANIYIYIHRQLHIHRYMHYIPGPPKEPKIMDQYPKIETIGSTGSIILAILEVQVYIYVY